MGSLNEEVFGVLLNLCWILTTDKARNPLIIIMLVEHVRLHKQQKLLLTPVMKTISPHGLIQLAIQVSNQVGITLTLFLLTLQGYLELQLPDVLGVGVKSVGAAFIGTPVLGELPLVELHVDSLVLHRSFLLILLFLLGQEGVQLVRLTIHMAELLPNLVLLLLVFLLAYLNDLLDGIVNLAGLQVEDISPSDVHH